MRKKPPWPDKKLDFRAMHNAERALHGLSLHTVCHQARCPNISECFARGTATFLIMGEICTRGCLFCGVARGVPGPLDPGEPERVVEAVRRLGIRHAVITSVTRDDLDDGGANAFIQVLQALRRYDASMTIEVLVPDFRGEEALIAAVVDAGPDIFGHNIETVPALYAVRKNADYGRSLGLLECAKRRNGGMGTKSALMLGLGESEKDVMKVIRDLRGARCDYLSIGQYLQPGRGNLPVAEYIP
ncbi:MAG: lipoyl synthase, partial [Chrysiogenales bacterium]